jgi:hypothetical protein
MSREADGLHPSTVVEPALSLQWISLDDEIVLFDPLRNKVYRFNGTGGFIWRCLEAGSTVGDIARHVGAQYRLSDESATETVDAFLNQLLELGLLGAQTASTRGLNR